MILSELEKEIFDLKQQINKIKLQNFKNRTIKNLKISAKLRKKIASYVLSAHVQECLK